MPVTFFESKFNYVVIVIDYCGNLQQTSCPSTQEMSRNVLPMAVQVLPGFSLMFLTQIKDHNTKPI